MKTMKMDIIKLAQGFQQAIFAYVTSSEKGVLIKEIPLTYISVFFKPQMQSIKLC